MIRHCSSPLALLAFLPMTVMAQAPVITRQPQSVTVVGTSGATFIVSASGSPFPGVRWEKNGQAVTDGMLSVGGENNSVRHELTLTNVHSGNAGTYTAILSNRSGTVTSSPAVLTIEAPLVITTYAPIPVPFSLAVDSEGSVYVSDSSTIPGFVGQGAIHKISIAGVVTTLPRALNLFEFPTGIGNGTATLLSPARGLAVDRDDNLYFGLDGSIRKVSPAGTFTTLAGDILNRGTVDGPGTLARFDLPQDLAVDAAGNVYVADSTAYTIRKVTAAGVVTTLAGSARQRGTVDGAGAAARFFSPQAVAVDSTGNVYVADASVIRKITAEGEVTTLAGSASQRGSVDGTGAAARFSSPSGLVVDSADDIYVADRDEYVIRKITPTGVVTTVAGIARQRGGTDGTGSVARFLEPSDLAIGTNGKFFISDKGNNMIRKGVVNRNPTIQASAPTESLAARTDYTFTATGSDPDGDAVTFNWNFGDGSMGVTAPAATHRWLIGGLYSVNVTALDGKGGGAERYFNVDVRSDVTVGAWTRRADGLAVNDAWSDVIFAGNQFVAVASSGSPPILSSDGITWTTAPAGTGLIGCRGIAFGGGRYVVVGARAASQVIFAGAAHSINGRDWQFGNVPTGPRVFSSVTYGDGRFVAVGEAGAAATSSDGIAWQLSTTGVVDHLARVRFADGLFVAVGQGGRILTSADGFTWTARMVGIASTRFEDVARYAGLWYALAASALYSSPDGMTWTRVNTSAPQGRFGIADGALVVAGNDRTIALTENAQVWATITLGVGVQEIYNAVAEGNGSIVVVGNTTGAANGVVYQARALPRILTQPASQVLTGNDSTSLTVRVANVSGVVFQWRKDGAAIAGATGSTITLGPNNAAASYSVTVTNGAGSVTSNPAVVISAPPNPGRLVNLSVLTSVAADGDNFSLGFVVGGAGTSGVKPLIIRAAGPSLVPLGVSGALDDPKLEVFAGTSKTGENDNWGGASSIATGMAGVGAFAFINAASKDAAVMTSVPSGDNSVKVSAAGSGTGAVIAEIYDATSAAAFTTATPRLVNVSVLKNLGTELTIGFVIGGSTPWTVLVRAVGPTLGAAPFNVSGVVTDPQLALYSGLTKTSENNDWAGPPF